MTRKPLSDRLIDDMPTAEAVVGEAEAQARGPPDDDPVRRHGGRGARRRGRRRRRGPSGADPPRRLTLRLVEDEGGAVHQRRHPEPCRPARA